MKLFAVSSNTIVLLLLSFCNALLLVLLFYFALPHMEFKRSESDAKAIVESLMGTSSTDLAIYWDIRLDKNTRSVNAFEARSPKDKTILLRFLKKPHSIRMTAAMNPSEVFSLLGNVVNCETHPFLASQITANTLDSVSEAELFSNPDSFVCLIPITNNAQMLVGQLTLAWKVKPKPEVINAALIQAQSLIK